MPHQWNTCISFLYCRCSRVMHAIRFVATSPVQWSRIRVQDKNLRLFLSPVGEGHQTALMCAIFQYSSTSSLDSSQKGIKLLVYTRLIQQGNKGNPYWDLQEYIYHNCYEGHTHALNIDRHWLSSGWQDTDRATMMYGLGQIECNDVNSPWARKFFGNISFYCPAEIFLTEWTRRTLVCGLVLSSINKLDNFTTQNIEC